MIRQARAGDAGDIAWIANRVIADTLITFTTTRRDPADVRADILRRGAAYLVLEQAGRVSGFATYGAFRPGPGYAGTCEHTILLDPAVQGHGHGRNLLERLEAVAVGQGRHVMVGAVSGANPAGIAFHAAMGFAEVGRLPQVGRKAGRWLDLVLMQKMLTPS